MNLRNKKTGELKEFDFVGAVQLGEVNEIYSSKGYASLAELNEEWEDYEESEDFWFIDPVAGIVSEPKDPALWNEKYDIELMKSTGNYFETKEEAEKAVEKLEAWKRLKDKGLKFDGWTRVSDGEGERITIELKSDNPVYGITGELELLFGGEND